MSDGRKIGGWVFVTDFRKIQILADAVMALAIKTGMDHLLPALETILTEVGSAGDHDKLPPHAGPGVVYNNVIAGTEAIIDPGWKK